MKFPSLIKLPKYSKFNFAPRYYDPVKEEIEQRTHRIKTEMDAQRAIGSDDRARFRAEMEHVFKHREKQERSSSIMQITFILLFLSIFVGYLFYGNNVIYGAIILIPAYIFYRRKAYVGKKNE